jgi:hypothetical protein
MNIINKVAAPIYFALASMSIYAGAPPEPYRLLLSGPVESVDNATHTVSVLGHRLVIKNTAAILPGHRLDVFGGLSANGSLSAAMVQDTAKYVASGDRILMVGAVTAIDRSRGKLFLGNATVDYTPLLGNVRFKAPGVGEVIEVSGSQPAGRNLILAARISRTEGVTAGGKAVGVTAGGQALGVTAGGKAVGVTAGGQALGVTAGGSALGVTAGGSALGVTAGGKAVGVTAGGQALGVTAGGSALGVTAGGKAVGVTAGGQALGVTAGGSALGVTAGGQALGVTAGGSALGVTAGGHALGVTAGGQALGLHSGGAL